MSYERILIRVGSLLTIFLAFAAYWSMPVFAAGGVFVLFTSALLAVYLAKIGANRSAAVAMYFVLSACLPFVVSRDSTFYFGQGYLLLAPVGMVLAVVLLACRKRRAVTT